MRKDLNRTRELEIDDEIDLLAETDDETDEDTCPTCGSLLIEGEGSFLPQCPICDRRFR